MFFIWWNMESVVYYEPLKLNEIVTVKCYRQQLERLNNNLIQKRPLIALNCRKVIVLHAIAITLKKHMELEWEVLPHPAYSPNLTPSDYHLFRSMQYALEDTHFHNYGEVENWVAEWVVS